MPLAGCVNLKGFLEHNMSITVATAGSQLGTLTVPLPWNEEHIESGGLLQEQNLKKIELDNDSGTEVLEKKQSEQPSQLSNGPQLLNSRTAHNLGTPAKQSPAAPCQPL
ncbi:hypothetical protein NDU88_004915 [Pleurodeles waltl]|uniref:Uncharacterized protein n=1 Tax=Pleurodeles waltl TaxID=8319 RepID=A0AAV7MAL0_PLEWA|nr:hypothetical protein NDU88_004915 [Pleurodeles waltl]